MVHQTIETNNLSKLPTEELATLAEQVMIPNCSVLSRDQLETAVRERLQLIERIPIESLFDVVVRAHRPVSRSAGKIELVREISRISFTRYDGLSHRALEALALLRGLTFSPNSTNRELQQILSRSDGLSGWLTKKRRDLAAKVIGSLFSRPEKSKEYQFLPDKKSSNESLTGHIKQQGVVDGIASKIRGAADGYIDAKLDEIEQRIDEKLEQIDRRLAEWRDQEIANRLKILKVTLAGSILIALISLGYIIVKYYIQ